MFGEEEQFHSLLTRNPTLGERLRKFDENKRVESIIATDIAKLVAYQHGFLSKLTLDLIHTKKMLNNPNIKMEIPNDEGTIFAMEESARLTQVMCDIEKLILNWEITGFNPNSEFALNLLDLHQAFDRIVSLRNQVLTETRFVFSPLNSLNFSVHEHPHEDNQSTMEELFSLKSVFFDESFVPTKRVIQQIAQYFNGENPVQSLNTLNEKLRRAIEELIISKGDYVIPSISATDFCRRPPYDVIRESQLFRDANESSSWKLDSLRTDLSKSRRQIYDAIMELRSLAASIKESLIPPMAVNMQTEYDEEDVRLQVEQRQLLLVNQAIKYSNIDFSKDFVVVEFRKWLENSIRRIQNGEDCVIDTLKSGFDKYTRQMRDQCTSLEAHYEFLQGRIEEWRGKDTKENDTVFDSERREMQMRIRELEQELSQIRESIRQTYDRAKQSTVVPETVTMKQFIPPSFESMFNKQSSFVNPKREWLRSRLEFNQRATSELERRVESTQSRLKMMREEVAERRKLLEELKARKASGPPQYSVSEHRNVVMCPVCQLNARDVFITRCGHTFCHKCIDAIQRQEGTSKCPECDAFFVPTTVKSFNW